jgi:hypothetical protein
MVVVVVVVVAVAAAAAAVVVVVVVVPITLGVKVFDGMSVSVSKVTFIQKDFYPKKHL